MKEIKALELTRRLEAGEPLAVVDVREADEYAGWHIAGSRNLPVYEALKRGEAAELEGRAGSLPKDRSIVTVCRAGIVSRKAAEVLEVLGHDAMSLSGGMRGWGEVWTVAPIALRSCPDATLLQIRRNGKGCLSYLLGAAGDALVVDPSVEVAAFVDAAEQRGLKISRVLETHVHADHISRARELCEKTGAKLMMPPNRRAVYPFDTLVDGTTFEVGGVSVEVVATPGHTTESSCYLIGGEAMLTGDTLFVGAVGRPDLEKGDAGAEAGARMLYRSLKERILSRDGDLRIYPCHHSDPIGFDRQPIGCTLAEARRAVSAVELDEAEFVRTIVASLRAKPGNFESIIALNEGRAGLEGIDPLELEAGPNCCAAG